MDGIRVIIYSYSIIIPHFTDYDELICKGSILAKYQILTESVNAITSVTTKINREIINPLANFRYSSITAKLFIGFKIKNFNSAQILEAEKAKALFDFLYFRFIKNNGISKTAVKNLRLNWENISRAEFKKAYSYSKLISSQKIKNLFNLIRQEYYSDLILN